MFYLLTYAVLMCGIAIGSIRKNKSIIYSLMWSAYAVSAIFCVICKVFQEDLYLTGISQSKWYDLSDTTMWGYLLIILCCLIAFRPFKKFDKNKALEILGNSRGSRQFYTIFSWAYIVCALIFVSLSINTVLALFSTSDYGLLRSTLYGNGENESNFVMTTNFLGDFCYKLCLQFKLLSVFVSFTMIKEKYKTKLASILLFVTFCVYYLYVTGNAARGGLLIFCFCSMLIGTCFWKYIHKSSKVKICIAAVVLLGFVFSFFMMVTVSRFGNDGGSGNPILRNIFFYLGHGPIEFSKITGSLREFAYGKTIIGRLLNHYFGTPYSWEAIQFEIGYPSLGPVFVTYLGYLYTDFGSIGCLVFVTFWSQFMCRLIRVSPRRISTIFLFLYYMNYFVTGIFAVGRLEYAAFITAHVIFLCIRFVEDLLKVRYRGVYYSPYNFRQGGN